MAKTDADYLTEILVRVELIERKIADLTIVYREASFIQGLLSRLTSTNDELIQKIRAQAQILSASTVSSDILVACETIKKEITAVLKPSAVITTASFISYAKKDKSKRYVADCKTYASQADISKKEIQIETFPFSDRLHRSIVSGHWKGYLHAHLTDNFLIMYHWYPEQRYLVYEAIIPHTNYD